jgi:hypothetical protein
MPTPDAVSEKANEVYAWLSRHPFPEHPPDLGFIFRMVGLRVGSQESRDVFERLLDRLALEREYREEREGHAQQNGHHGVGTQT